MEEVLLIFLGVGVLLVFIGIKFLLNGIALLDEEHFEVVGKIRQAQKQSFGIALKNNPIIEFTHPKTNKKIRYQMKDRLNKKHNINDDIDLIVFVDANDKYKVLVNKYVSTVIIPSIFLFAGFMSIVISILLRS